MTKQNTTWQSYDTIAIKIGSALLVNADSGKVNQAWLESLATDIATMARHGKKVLVISSGAVALGRKRLGLMASCDQINDLDTNQLSQPRPLSLAQKQACAAAGQALLTQAYENVLAPHHLVTAQALLTINDTENRRQWLNATQTLRTLLSMGAIPIINENDTVATDEIRYGDNDRLAARVAQMVGADLLILLSDIDGLYTADPALDKTAKHLPLIETLSPEIMAMGGGANQDKGVGSGGMATKLQAAKIATLAGCDMVIAKGEDIHPLHGLWTGTKKHTHFKAQINTQTARKQWIANTLEPKGMISIDQGAVSALLNGKSLLCAGITHVEGQFEKGDAVQICGPDKSMIAIGLSSFNAEDAKACQGLSSEEIDQIIGYAMGAPLIHRDNLVLNT